MTNMTNMHDRTIMSNILNMQIPFAYAPPPRIYTPPLSILPILQICKESAINTPPLFSNSKKYQIWKNAEYDIHPPGLPAAGRPGVGTKNLTNMQNMQNMQNNNFCEGMFL